MEPEIRRELRQYAWSYFDRHAEQRLKTFNFYLVLSGAVVAGLLAFARTPEGVRVAWPLPLLLSFLSFVFWRLDDRNRELTRHSEEALKTLEDELPLADESDGVPHRCKLFRREEYEFTATRKPHLSMHFSYTTCFRLIFCLFGVGGLLIGIALLALR